MFRYKMSRYILSVRPRVSTSQNLPTRELEISSTHTCADDSHLENSASQWPYISLGGWHRVIYTPSFWDVLWRGPCHRVSCSCLGNYENACVFQLRRPEIPDSRYQFSVLRSHVDVSLEGKYNMSYILIDSEWARRTPLMSLWRTFLSWWCTSPDWHE